MKSGVLFTFSFYRGKKSLIVLAEQTKRASSLQQKCCTPSVCSANAFLKICAEFFRKMKFYTGSYLKLAMFRAFPEKLHRSTSNMLILLGVNL